MPPKLEDKVSPQELLSAMRQGVLKTALAKRYKASDEDFALMLYPMYRRGELTKQEFNDFFNLVAITSTKGAPLPGGQSEGIKYAAQEPEDLFRTITANLDLPPDDLAELDSEDVEEVTGHLEEETTFEELPDFVVARKSEPVLSDDEALKALGNEPQAPPEATKAPKPPERPRLELPQKRQLSVVKQSPEKALLQAKEETARPKPREEASILERRQPAAPERATPEASREDLAAAAPAPKGDKTPPPESPKKETPPPPKSTPQRQPEHKAVQPAEDGTAAKRAEAPHPAQRPPDWSKIKSLFENVFTRLNSIEARLAKIEKKLPE